MKVVFEMVRELSSEQVNVIVAGIGFISAFTVAVFGLLGSAITFFLNKRNERKIELRKIKENQYVEFLKFLAMAKVATRDEEHQINMVLSEKIQTIYLIGNKKVQVALNEFLKIFISNEAPAKEKQDRLYAQLIKTMKKDLYREKGNSLDEISFTVFDGKR